MRKFWSRASVLSVSFALAAMVLAPACLAYGSQVQMDSIGITLIEGDEDREVRSWYYDNSVRTSGDGDLWLLDPVNGEYIKPGAVIRPGVAYGLPLSVKKYDPANIPFYWRSTSYCYWQEGNEKRSDLDAGLIRLSYVEDPEEFWRDTGASTAERRVVYGRMFVNGAKSPRFTEFFSVDADALRPVVSKDTEIADDGRLKTVTFTKVDYGNADARLEVHVDATQTHNMDGAALSAWGVKVVIGEDGRLSFAS